jgi:hypothetical protein
MRSHINGGMQMQMGNVEKKVNGIFVAVGLVFVATILVIVLLVSGLVYGCKQVKEKGLKGVTESVWNGSDTNAPVN